MSFQRRGYRTQAMLISVDHVQITVPKDCEVKAREFYCGLLGLQETAKPENRKSKGGFWIALGETQVHISLEEGVDRTKTRAHVAYRVDNLDKWREKLNASGIETKESLPFPNARAFEFRDPFGNRVEFIQYI